MIFQATHHINFAQGEQAMFSAYIALVLIQAGVPYWAAFALALAFAFVSGVLLERLIVRPFEDAPVLSVVVVFLGMLFVINSLAGWLFTYSVQPFPSPFPARLGSRYLSPHELGTILVTLIVLVLVFVLLSLHAARACNARGGGKSGIKPPCRHSRRPDAVTRVGPCRCGWRSRRDHGRARSSISSRT